MEIALSQGVEPRALTKRPVLLDGLDIYLKAFQELLSDRTVGMAVGYIPWSSIHKWAVLHGFTDPEDIATFTRYIRALENEARKEDNK